MCSWADLPQWAKEAIVAAFVGALFGTLFGEIRPTIMELIKRRRDSIDRKVLGYLGGLARGANATPEQIASAIKLRKKKVETSLYRATDRNQAESDAEGKWHKIIWDKAN
jgi:hypothetical protein